LARAAAGQSASTATPPKAALGDEPLRQLGTQQVELVRPVRRLAQQDETCAGDQVEQVIDRPDLDIRHTRRLPVRRPAQLKDPRTARQGCGSAARR
jgi:hypothetical protein